MALPQGGIRYFRKYLFDTPIVEADFSLGFIRDVPRWAIPNGGSYSLIDFFVDSPGKMYKRGGSSYQSGTLSPPAASNPTVIAVATPNFNGDPRIVAYVSDGASTTYAYDVSNAVTPVSAGSVPFSPGGNQVFFDEKLICPDGLGATGVKKLYLVAGTLTVKKLGGTPPNTRYACVHNGFLVLANSVAHPNRLWFSPATSSESDSIYAITAVSTGSKTFTIAGNETSQFIAGYTFSVWNSTGNDASYTVASSALVSTNTVITVTTTPASATADGYLGPGWDVNNSYVDTDQPITGLASIQGALLVFSRGKVDRILGSIPPGFDNFDMSLQPLADVGCIDARSIVQINDVCYFANEAGIYFTSGTGIDSLTTKKDNSGISSFWRDTLVSFSPALGALVAMGSYQEKYLLASVKHNNGTLTSLLCYLPTMSWMQLSTNLTATLYATSYAPTNEIYIGSPTAVDSTHARVIKLSGIFLPTTANTADHDGTEVAPSWTSRVITNSMGLKRYGFGHLSYKMLSDNSPSLTIKQATGLDADSGFVTVTEGQTQSKTTAVKRSRFRFFKDTQGVSVQIVQDNQGSTTTEIYSVEAEVGDFFIADGQ